MGKKKHERIVYNEDLTLTTLKIPIVTLNLTGSQTSQSRTNTATCKTLPTEGRPSRLLFKILATGVVISPRMEIA
jgi:hypothetical protein